MKSKKIIASVLSLAIVIGMMPTFVGAAEVDGGEDQEQTAQEEMSDDGAGDGAAADPEEPEDTEEEADSEADVYRSSSVQASYVEADGTSKTHEAAVLDGSETELAGGWYIADSSLIYNEKITLKGDVTIILADGVSVSITDTATDTLACIYGRNYDLTIYGQSNNSGVLTLNGEYTAVDVKDFEMNGGTVNATTVTEKGTDGIESRGAMTIRGGNLNVSVTGGEGWATSALTALDSLDIYGGKISLTGTSEGIHLNGSDSVVTFHGGNTVINAPITFAGNVVLDFDDKASSLTADPFKVYDNYSVTVAEGKIISGKTGTLSKDDIAELSGEEIKLDEHDVYYFDGDGYQKIASPTVLTGNETRLAPGFYTIEEDVTFDHGIELTDADGDGTVNIILQGGHTLNIGTADNRIQGCGLYMVREATAYSDLNIYRAVRSSGTMNVYTEGAVAHAFDGKGFGMYGGTVNLDSTGIAFYAEGGNDYSQFKMTSGNLTIKGSDAIFCSGSKYDIDVNTRDAESSLTCISTGNSSSYSLFTRGTVNISSGTVNISGGRCEALDGFNVDWKDGSDTVFTLENVISSGTQINLVKSFTMEGSTEIFAGKHNITDISGKTLIPARTDVKYFDINGKEQEAVGASIITGQETVLYDGTYVVLGNIEIYHGFKIEGDVDLILADGASLKMGKEGDPIYVNGISYYSPENTLRIFGQKDGTGSLEIVSDISIPVYTNEGKLVIAGGRINLSNYGTCGNIGNLEYYSGQVNIPNGELEAKNVYLSWNRPSDSFELGTYVVTGTVHLNRSFMCDGAEISGDISDVSTINGKKLTPPGVKYNVPYVDENGETQYIDAFEIDAGVTVSDGWYVVGGQYNTLNLGQLTIKGDAKIILPDGKTLNVDNETGRVINCNNKSITFYGQANGSGIFSASIYHPADQAMMGNASSVTVVGGQLYLTCWAAGGKGLKTDSLTIKNGKVICLDCDIEVNNTLTQEGGYLTVRESYDEHPAVLRSSGTASFSGGELHINCASSYFEDVTVSWTSGNDKYNFGDLNISADGSITFEKAFKTDGIDCIIGTYKNGDQFCDCKLIPLTDPVSGPALEGYAATVTDDIGVKFYYTIPAAMRDASKTKVVFTLDGEEPVEVPFDAANVETVEGEEYCFFRFNVYATQLTAPVKAEFMYNGKTFITKDDFTVRDYIKAAYGRTKQLALLFLLEYGSNLQNYFGYRTDDLANKDMASYVDPLIMGVYFNGVSGYFNQQVNNIKQYVPEPVINSNITAVKYYGASLVMKEKLYMKYYFEIKDPSSFDISNYSAYDRNVNNGSGAVSYEVGYDTTGKYIYVKVPVNMGDCTSVGSFDVYLFEGDPAECSMITVSNYDPVVYMKKTIDGDQFFRGAMVYLYSFGKEFEGA